MWWTEKVSEVVTFKPNLNEAMAQAMSQAKEQGGNDKYKGTEKKLVQCYQFTNTEIKLKRENMSFSKYTSRKEGRNERSSHPRMTTINVFMYFLSDILTYVHMDIHTVFL